MLNTSTSNEPPDNTGDVNIGRGVDTAMADERPAKKAVRDLWLKEIKRFNGLFPTDDVPLYLTLPGENALDVRLLAENGLISLTEVGGVAAESQGRVIAIESSPRAVLGIQKLFPGLKIIEQNFKDFIAGDSLIRFPTNRDHENYCCAKIINLDLQASLAATDTDGSVAFPVLVWIRKIAQLHAAKKPQLEWCLCLTLHSDITWPSSVSRSIQQFLLDAP